MSAVETVAAAAAVGQLGLTTTGLFPKTPATRLKNARYPLDGVLRDLTPLTKYIGPKKYTKFKATCDKLYKQADDLENDHNKLDFLGRMMNQLHYMEEAKDIEALCDKSARMILRESSDIKQKVEIALNLNLSILSLAEQAEEASPFDSGASDEEETLEPAVAIN
ncbi:hypothetical protein H0H87_003639, partial [Tephrocybe sp. NHM501043]